MKTIANLKDFCPKTTIVIDGDANFTDFPNITDLGNLQEIKGFADFENSQVKSLGNLQTIGGSANFQNSQVQSLGNLQTIEGSANFQNSQVQSLGNLQTIGGYAYFCESQVQSLGNLQTIGGTAYFQNSQIQSLGNLQKIGGSANFQNSEVQNLGNLQTIEGDAFFRNSKVQDLGNLVTIGVNTYFGNRTDLKAKWEKRISEKSSSDSSVPEKTFQNTDSDGAKKNVSDIQFWGDGDTFKLISKAWSKKEGWMKSTKAMEIKGVGCVIQVTTQQGSNVAEAVTFAPNCRIKEETDAEGKVIKRTIIGNLVA